MERSEPSLVPEWLKNTGNSAGGGSTSHSGIISPFKKTFCTFMYFFVYCWFLMVVLLF